MNRIRDLAIKYKLVLSFSGILFLFFLLGFYNAHLTKSIIAASRVVELRNFTGVELITDIERNVMATSYLSHEALYPGEEKEKLKAQEDAQQRVEKTLQLLSEFIDLVKNEPQTQQKALEVTDLFQKYCDLSLGYLKGGQSKKTQVGGQKEIGLLWQIEEALNDLRNEDISALSIALGRIDRLAAYARTSYFWLFIIAAIMSLILAWIITSAITAPIRDLMAGMRRLASGSLDYKMEIKGKDEIGALQTGFMDMADRLKKAHSELEEERDTLEIKVKERTKELEQLQAKLIQSAKMSAVGQLAGGVAHEINNPLTGVLNNVQLIKLEAEGKEKFDLSDFKELLDIVEDSAMRCKRITQGLLDFSRAGKRPHQITSLKENIESALALAEHDIRLKNIKIIRDFGEGVPRVEIDPHQLQQVFLDIINNAKWALRDKEHGELKVKTQAGLDGKTAIVSFSDTGCGILPEHMVHMFEPFFTTKSPGEGTGLGLSICYGIIKEHHGTIEAASPGKDKGATFTITLPAAGK